LQVGVASMRSIYRFARDTDMLVDEDAARLHAVWLSLCDEAGLPRMSALAQQSLDWCLDQIEIMVPLEGGLFHFAHHGKNLAAASGFKLKGKNTGEFKSGVGAFFGKTYAMALEGRKPVFAFNESAMVTPVHAWRRHLFPLFNDDGSPACIIGLIKPTLLRHEVWRSISSIAGFGAGSLEPILDEKGNVYDFLIVEAAGLAPLLRDESPATLNQLLQRQLDPATITRLTAAALGQMVLSETIEVKAGEGASALQVDVLASEIGLILNMRDVSAVRAAQVMLEKRTEELKLAQQLGRIGAWRMNVDASVVWWSPEMYALLRLKPGVFTPTTKAIWELYVDGDAKRAGEVQMNVLKTGRTQSLDVSARRGDGSTGHFTMEFSLERDAAGGAIGIFGTIQDITERKEAELNLEKLAYFDPLTSLPNRAMFKKELDRRVQSSLVSGKLFFLLLMDLDHFKDVNDALGHGAGDALLVRVARLLRETAPKEALVARLGGDEFAVLYQPSENGMRAEELAGEIVKQGSGAFLLDEGEVQIGISIGISEGVKDGAEATQLLKNADLALYSAKGAGRGRFHFYKNVMSELAEDRMSLSRDLKHALAENKLELHFQPLVAMTSRKVIGFEALLRWNHPVRGYIPPSDFIPIAESSSLICDLGFWAMTEACKTLKSWLDAGNPPLTMAVNVSAVQFWQSSFEAEVKGILESTGIPAELLTLEVTESIFIDKTNNRVRSCFDELARVGVGLAIDDFGTGFSSLGYLSELPFEKLKIDRSFISGIDSAPEKQKLLQGIVGLARGLGMTTIVEGAETAGEVVVLQSLGCNIVQGFYFARPQPFSEWRAMIGQIEGEEPAARPEPERLSAAQG
jgi:diguanylate cyclase (GGDEF)-like protein